MTMNTLHLSDIEPVPLAHVPLPDDAAGLQRWRELVGEIGAEIAAPLTAALDRLDALGRSGRIDRQGLRALRCEIESARRIGMEGQQLARIASGRVRQSRERLPLAATVRALLAERGEEVRARGAEVRPPAECPSEVAIDAALLSGLVGSVLDWALGSARSPIDFEVEARAWPPQTRLRCRFAHRAPDCPHDGAPTPAELRGLDSIHWRLVQQTAWAVGMPLRRTLDGGATVLAIDFPRAVVHDALLHGVNAVEVGIGAAEVQALDIAPLAGSHVLVVAQRREVRAEVHDALRHLGLMIDFVDSVAEAQAFCRQVAPQAVIVESPLLGEQFRQLRREVAERSGSVAFIELVEDSQVFEMGGVGESDAARVGRDALAQGLPAALLFELSKA